MIRQKSLKTPASGRSRACGVGILAAFGYMAFEQFRGQAFPYTPPIFLTGEDFIALLIHSDHFASYRHCSQD